MGDIKKITAKVDLPEPGGWDPEKDQFNLPFAIELKENWHVHWADIRIEMTSEDFEGFAKSIIAAYENWEKDGKPPVLPEMKRYSEYPDEEGFDHFKNDDRNNPRNNSGKPRFHFKKFPRTESGKQYFDPTFQIELQKPRPDAPNGWYHLHYKNFRIEIGRKQLIEMAEAFQNSLKK